MNDNIVIVKSTDGDWIQLWMGGELKAEGHSLSEQHVLEAVGLTPKVYHDASGHWIESGRTDWEAPDGPGSSVDLVYAILDNTGLRGLNVKLDVDKFVLTVLTETPTRAIAEAHKRLSRYQDKLPYPYELRYE
jgi:hypothetical protein